MKKRFLLALSATLLTAAVGVGASFAIFTDTATSDNTFTAGHVCITSQRDAFDNVPGPMFYMTGMQGSPDGGITPGRYPMMEVSSTSPAGYVPPTPGGWAPGDSVTRTLTVFNGGPGCPSPTLDAKLVRATAELTPGSYVPLADKMKVTVYAQHWGGGLIEVGQAYLSDFLLPAGVPLVFVSDGEHPTLPGFSGGGLPPNLHMEFTVAFDLDTPNAYQGQEMIVHFTLHAEQVANNP